ncbi:MAG: 50S ribosomal protein L23 [Deltaproteobacteria bacterium]|nr:50S ribosomal protein L23 [Deltaproteobacteria bacterium]MBI4373979.1 50S ribosomal protein L23 [Deltaproteobacteria bacterium]
MKAAHEILKRAVVTEKSVRDRANSRYAFEVVIDASKPVIRQAVEDFFKVEVVSVRTVRVPEKRRRFGRYPGKRSAWKKAIVTLAAGQKIPLLEAE